MIKELTRTVAYSCPFCAEDVQRKIGIFDFSGDGEVELKCSEKHCREVCATINAHGDKYKISVNCPTCGETHIYTISKGAFWSTPLMAFNCMNFNIQIFFFGEKKLVAAAYDENEQILDDLAGSAFDNLSEDYKLVFTLLDHFHKLLLGERIVCKCGSRDISPGFDGQNIVLECEKCERKFIFEPSESVLDMLGAVKGDLKL